MTKHSLRMVLPATLIGLLCLVWQTATAAAVKPSNRLLPVFVPASTQAGVASFIPHYRFRPVPVGRLPGMDRARMQYRPDSGFVSATSGYGLAGPRSVL